MENSRIITLLPFPRDHPKLVTCSSSQCTCISFVYQPIPLARFWVFRMQKCMHVHNCTWDYYYDETAKLYATYGGIGSVSWLVRRGRGRATMCELNANIIAESELLQPALNEIHKFCFQHWSRSCGTCGTSSGAPKLMVVHKKEFTSYKVLQPKPLRPLQFLHVT